MADPRPPAVVEDLDALLRGDAAALANRFPIYDRLRDATPVLVHDGVVYVSRHEDVRAVLSDPVTFSSVRGHAARAGRRTTPMSSREQAQVEELSTLLAAWMNENDDPRHAELRRIVASAFTPRRIAEMRAQIQRFVDELLAAADSRGEIELVDELAFPLPLTVVSEMLGFGSERHDDIREWSDELAVAFDSGYANLDAAYSAYMSFRQLISETIEQRRSDGGATGLFQTLLEGSDDGIRLTDNELTGMLVLLLFAGHETTTNLIGNSVLALLGSPQQLSLLRDNPSLAGPAVNEFLRYNGSVHSLRRVVTRDSEIAGVPVAEGQTVRLMLAAANRDPNMFPNPGDLDVRRTNAAQHIGLGFGIHRCLGQYLARLETEVALTTLITRYPDMELAAGLELHPTVTMHGPKRLPLRLR